MKYIAWLFGVLVILVLALVAAERLAAERVEVVEVHASEPDGSIVTTRLWVVDYNGGLYLRVGADGSGWYSRIQANAKVDVMRDGTKKSYMAVPEPESSLEINELMQAKYTWGDSFIGQLVGGREGSIPIRLNPI